MENKKTITITQQVKELIFDIKNKTYIAGRVREAEGTKNFESASLMTVSDDTEINYQIRRSLSYAFSLLKSMLHEHISQEGTTGSNLINEEIDNDGELVLSLNMSNDFSNVSIDALGMSIHQYLVDMALAEWYTITNKEEAQIYNAHSEVSWNNIKHALYISRIGKVRRKLKPF